MLYTSRRSMSASVYVPRACRVLPCSAALAKIPKPPAEKCRWGPCAGALDAFVHLSLAIVEPRKHEWMRAVLWNACHVWGGSGAVRTASTCARCTPWPRKAWNGSSVCGIVLVSGHGR